VIRAVSRGIFRVVGLPRFGRQDLGYGPGGAQDLFALRTGNILLDNDPGSPALEMVVPPAVRFLADCCFVITGAARLDVKLEQGDGKVPVRHGEVCFAARGSLVTFGARAYGFRSYLCYRRAPRDFARLVGRARGRFDAVSSWHDPDRRIRCTKGPEYSLLPSPEEFLATAWETTTQLDDMGLRLTSRPPMDLPTSPGMVSAPVNDGTVQLTSAGPIILLRERQTVGGYPRVLNVIGADVDLVAQYAPHQGLRFRLVGVRGIVSAAGRPGASGPRPGWPPSSRPARRK
jgi:allophanate hydrolase subunit 2